MSALLAPVNRTRYLALLAQHHRAIAANRNDATHSSRSHALRGNAVLDAPASRRLREHAERGGRQRGGRKSRSRTKIRKMIRSKRKRRSKKRKRISGTTRSTTPGHCREPRRRHAFISFPRSAWECRLGRSRVPAPAPNTQSVEDGIPTGTVGTSTGSSAVVFGEECQRFLVHEEPRCFLHHP